MKNNIISESEITEILTMHKSLKEQDNTKLNSDVTADLVLLRKAITAGCLKSGKILTNPTQTKYVYRATTKSGKIVDFTADMNYKFQDGSDSGKWKCDEIAQIDAKTAETAQQQKSMDDLKNEYKDKYKAQEYSELQYKSKSDDPSVYKKIPFKGVDTNFLYIPLYRKEFLATKPDDYPEGSPEREILQKLVAQGYIIDPTPLQRTGLTPVKFDNEQLGGLFPNGIVAYIDKRGLFKKTDEKSEQLPAGGEINPQECKKLINQYWEDYRDDISGDDVEFNKKKAQVMACKRRYYPNRWGLLGLAGNQIDKKIDVLSRKANEYDGLTTPSRTSKWLLN